MLKLKMKEVKSKQQFQQPTTGPQVFVKVVFDFEYMAEDGKKIFMKEGEILMLINKTNQDWWQVIRRGDRRPFYAPAKYVVELTPEDVESIRKRVQTSEMARDEMRLRMNHNHHHHRHNPHHHFHSNSSSFNPKRSSIATYGSGSTVGVHAALSHHYNQYPMDQAIANNKFQERYRSNSLDSILVAANEVSNNNNRAKSSAMPNRNSAFEMKTTPTTHQVDQQAHFIKKSPPPKSGILEKRPTFDSLDKRKSWSVDVKPFERGVSADSVIKSSNSSVNKNLLVSQQSQKPYTGSSKGRISAYQNTQVLFGSGRQYQEQQQSSATQKAPSNSSTLEARKKPVPLPRSKIPLPQDKEKEEQSTKKGDKRESKKVEKSTKTKGSEVSNAAGHKPIAHKSSLHSRFFSKRSKTDLGSDSLASYKAKKQPLADALAGSYKPLSSAKLPSFEKPVPQKRPENNIVFHNVSSEGAEVITVVNNKARSEKFVDEMTSVRQQQPQKPPLIKPELKEKPQFSTFKSQQQRQFPDDLKSSIESRLIKPMSKTSSESNLVQSLRRELDDENKIVEHVSTVEPVSISVNSDDTQSNSSEDVLEVKKGSKKDEFNKLVIDTSKAFPDKIASSNKKSSKRPQLKRVDSEEEEDEDGEEVDQGVAEVGHKKSEPLLITTQRLTDSRRNNQVLDPAVESMSEEADKSCSTSFDSVDDSVIMGESGEFCDSGADVFDLSSPGRAMDTSGESVHDIGSRTKSPSVVSTISRSPPSPEPNGLKPIRKQVVPDWDEYEDVQSGRKFYFNSLTKEKSWKPPRKQRGGSHGHDGSSSPEHNANSIAYNTDEVDTDEKASVSKSKEAPSGYEIHSDPDTGVTTYVNVFTGVRWMSATDVEGKEYFYEENGNKSCWVLPNVSQSIQDRNRSHQSESKATPKKPLTGSTRRLTENYLMSVQQQQQQHESNTSSEGDEDNLFVKNKLLEKRLNSGEPLTKTEMLEMKFTNAVSAPSASSNNFQIGNVSIVIIKQGPLNKTKLVENGKKQRKNWSVSYAVLTDTFLLFFKDQKTFASMQHQNYTHNNSTNHGKPDLCIDLKGASVDWSAGDKSKRSHVFEVSTLLGQTILMQDESLQTSAEWYQEIRETIEKLEGLNFPSSESNIGRIHHSSGAEGEILPYERKISTESNQSSTLNYPHERRKVSNSSTASSNIGSHNSKVNRTKSLKMKILGSNEEMILESSGSHQHPVPSGALSAPIASGNNPPLQLAPVPSTSKSNIREKLRKFFLRRPTMEDLFRKGIIKNEPVFGSTLRELHASEGIEVPLFVQKCIAEIEKGDFLQTDGVYRQSGNLSHIQRIRFQVDQGHLSILESVDDVHVLTGALKLFFRELKEPLIPWECVDKLLRCTRQDNKSKKIKQMREVISIGMPPSHRSTLAFLLRHLVRVTEFREHNRMQVPNLAIVFGPTLMWPPAHLITHNLALDMMQQNIIVEALLNHVDVLF